MVTDTTTQTLKNYIAGRWKESTSDELVEIRNPATDDIIAQYSAITRDEVDMVVEQAHDAFSIWRNTPPLDRSRLLMKLKNLLDDNHQDLAKVLCLEHGKTYNEAYLEMERGIENVEVACGVTTLMQGNVLEDAAKGIDEYSIRQPLGVSASLTPFNFPGMIPLWSLPYALACGNCFVMKSSPRVPMTAVRMFELIDQVGFPPGVVNLVLGDSEAGEALIDHRQVKTLSFVGSTQIGKIVYEKSAAAGKRAQVAAGAKNFGVAMPDADLDNAVTNLIGSAMGCSGQRCLALAGVIAVGEAYDKLRDRLIEAAKKLKVGFALDSDVSMGPVISRQAQMRIEKAIQSGIDEGADLALDGRGLKVDGYPNGYWIGPTILDNCRLDMRVSNEEIFGPVFCILRANNLDQAIDMINSSRYGNAAAIYTSSGSAARKFRYEVNAGNIGINIGVAAPMAYFPFGGVKDSFFGTMHAQGKDAFEFFTDAKVCVERWF